MSGCKASPLRNSTVGALESQTEGFGDGVMSTGIETPVAPAPAPSTPRASDAPPRRLLRGRPEDPAWARPGLFGVLLLAAVLVGWGLTRSGMSNTYYAAAVKSATESWKALFFGSIDPASFITV